MKETAPLWSIIELQFPARGSRPAGEDDLVRRRQAAAAGAVPGREAHHARTAARSSSARKGTLFTRTWHGGETDKDMFVLLPRKQFADYQPPEPTLPRTREPPPGVGRRLPRQGEDRCRSSATRRCSPSRCCSATSRCARGKPVEWDAANMRVTNNSGAEAFVTPEFRRGWTI